MLFRYYWIIKKVAFVVGFLWIFTVIGVNIFHITDILNESAKEQKLIYELYTLKKEIEVYKKNNLKEESQKYNLLQRRINNQLKEMWLHVSENINKTTKEICSKGKTSRIVQQYLDYFFELQQITVKDFEDLVAIDHSQSIKDKLAKDLSEIIQKQFYNLQQPEDCAKARKLVCGLTSCGYACQMHQYLHCFVIAYATKRTLVLDTRRHLNYKNKGWNNYFLPLSSCTNFSKAVRWSSDHQQHSVVRIPNIANFKPRPKQIPLAVPSDIYKTMNNFHSQTFVWWISQFTKYLFRYQPSMYRLIQEKKKKLLFQSPIVGIHIRRTDKLKREMKYHSIEEYMYWVKIYYKKLELSQKVEQKRVFIATDELSILPEARKKYPDYEFLSDDNATKLAYKSRYTETSLNGIISDIELLSDTDFLVCTFSSNVCRLAYEMMNHKHTDASNSFRSLDDSYYFQGGNGRKMKVIWPHRAIGSNQLNLTVGDIIIVQGNHWNGQAKGRHIDQKNVGLFPAYKVEDFPEVVDFPQYN